MVRTRMPGGVGGGKPRGASLSRFRRIKTILPHSIPFLLGRSRAEKAVILGSRETFVEIYVNIVFEDGGAVAMYESDMLVTYD